MAHYNLRYFLESLGKLKKNDVFLLQIGAMDGTSFDPVHEYITRFNWRGLLVEPMPDLFERLQETYHSHPLIHFEQAAITHENGEVTMHHLSETVIQSEKIPRWGLGASSLYTDRNALSFEEVTPHIEQIQVAGMTLEKLLEIHQIDAIDVLQIDTEGHDYHILKQLDFARFRPSVIHFEIVNLPPDEVGKAKKLLDEHGYIHAKCGYDLLAVDLGFFKLLP